MTIQDKIRVEGADEENVDGEPNAGCGEWAEVGAEKWKMKKHGGGDAGEERWDLA